MNSKNEYWGCLHIAEVQWSSQILTDVEKTFSCYIFLLFIVEAEILRAICVYVYNNFLFLRTLHLLASLARRNTNCSVSCFFNLLYSLYNRITLPPSRSVWFSKLSWNMASLNFSSGILAYARKVACRSPPRQGFEELTKHIAVTGWSVLLVLPLPASWAERWWHGDFMLFNWQNVRDKFCSQAA